MREILFRAKPKDSGLWIYGGYLSVVQFDNSVVSHCIAENKSEYDPMLKGNVHQIIKVDPNTICEYTGLKDKNGTKVFEGDIVKDENGIVCEVIHSDLGCYMMEYIGQVDRFFLSGEAKRCEVVGNKFDNELEVQDEE